MTDFGIGSDLQFKRIYHMFVQYRHGRKGFCTQFQRVLQLTEKLLADGREKSTAKVGKVINLRYETGQETGHT